MGKKAAQGFYDAALNYVKEASTEMVITSAEPANYAGVAAVALANVAIDDSDFTLATGDVSGRKATIAAQTDVEVDVTGTATHVCIVSADTLLYVTTCDSQAVVDGALLDTNAWKIEINAPS